ncbi:MAG: metallophosphatase [Longimicrobiales bacterium]|nr:metallophosphatase [Longimicrobiales bacterium]
MRRRRFLRVAVAGAAGGLLLPEWVRGQEPYPDEVRLVILHTNDTHSRMDPFPMDGGPFQGLGGVARRTTVIERVRAEHPNVLLLDSGDIFQGTPYFNFFKGEVEFKAMSAMNYQVATLGNHDFDNGVDGMVEMMPHAAFDFVSANYDVSGSPLEAHVRPWVIREVGGVRVGIFGLGVAFDGLVLASLHEGIRHTDPLAAARRAVTELRAQGCSLVVCLSHLGYRYGGVLPSDTRLAQEVEGIDLILGGHSHTFMAEPDVYPQVGGSQTIVNQVGWGGMRLGRIDVVLGPQDGSAPQYEAAHTPRAWDWSTYPVDAELD